MTDTDKYLLDLDDGLPMRISHEYAWDKLYALQAYLQMTMTAMRNKKWSAFNYIDLQAGPGKNSIEGKVYLGSPLVALTLKHPFTNYWFNELDSANFQALQTRVNASPYVSRVHLFQKDLNEAVGDIVDSIDRMDREAKANNEWPTFNVAFLDPEGLEVNWNTVQKLATVSRMDLIINFSISGILRNESHQHQIIDRFFGGDTWRQIKGDRKRGLINLYRKQLQTFDYHIVNSPDEYHDIAMRNSKNAEVYSIIFASKHPLGDDFWGKISKQVEKMRKGSNRLL